MIGAPVSTTQIVASSVVGVAAGGGAGATYAGALFRACCWPGW